MPEWEVFFNRFWEHYPRKVGKPAAKRAMKAKYGAVNSRLIAEGTVAWADYWVGSQTAEQFIPHPATFLNQDRWLDRIPAITPKKESVMEMLERLAERDA